MEENKTLKEMLEELVRNLDLDEESIGPMRDFLAQSIFPAVAAKVVVNNLHETFEGMNEQNRDMLGFEMQEEDFLAALLALIPVRIKEIKAEKEAFKNAAYVETSELS